jgi:hypothetical protein
VTSRNNVELILELPLLEQLGKIAVGKQQSLLITACQKQVRSLAGISRPRQNEWIVVSLGGAAPWPKDRPVMPPLADSPDRKWSTRNVDRRT